MSKYKYQCPECLRPVRKPIRKEGAYWECVTCAAYTHVKCLTLQESIDTNYLCSDCFAESQGGYL